MPHIQQSVIHSDPRIMSGEPVFVGTRVPLQTLIGLVERHGRKGLEEFLQGFDVASEQAVAALREVGKLHLVR